MPLPQIPLPLPLPFCSTNTSSYPILQNGSGQSLPVLNLLFHLHLFWMNVNYITIMITLDVITKKNAVLANCWLSWHLPLPAGPLVVDLIKK